MAVAITDFTLACQRGYRISAIKRVNSPHQRKVAGSLSIECQPIQYSDLDRIKCETLTSTPQCNGWPEGCSGSQWLAGFHAYAIENTTNAVLLDPVCCASPRVRIDSLSCASERINSAAQPFEHEILAGDLVYRGMQCWHQYTPNNTLVDLVWKMEICQILGDSKPARPFAAEACPPCECHCGIDTCADGKEPLRVVHKHLSPDKCSCDCLCRYECI